MGSRPSALERHSEVACSSKHFGLMALQACLFDYLNSPKLLKIKTLKKRKIIPEVLHWDSW